MHLDTDPAKPLAEGVVAAVAGEPQPQHRQLLFNLPKGANLAAVAGEPRPPHRQLLFNLLEGANLAAVAGEPHP